MVKYFLTIVMLSSILFSADLNWNDNYNRALKDAKAQNKDIYMLITSNDCRWCRKFESTTLQKKAVIDRLKEQYVLLHVDRDMDDFPKNFKSKRVPRHYFLTSKGQIIYSFLGYWEKEDFFSFLKDVDKKR